MTVMTKSKAKATIVNFNGIEIEMLHCGGEDFRIAVSQVAEKFSLLKNNAVREVKLILSSVSADVSLLKVSSDLNSQAVQTVSLSQFESLIIALNRKGNPEALELIEATINHTLTQFCCDAFGIAYEQEERSAKAKARLEGTGARRSATDAIKGYLDRTPGLSDGARKFAYSNATDKLNVLLTGHPARYWVAKVGCGKDELRNHLSSGHLDRLKTCEDLIQRKVDRGMSPMEATESAVEALLYDVWDEAQILGLKDLKTQNRERQRKCRANKKNRAD